jgi:hypothetical protein
MKSQLKTIFFNRDTVLKKGFTRVNLEFINLNRINLDHTIVRYRNVYSGWYDPDKYVSVVYSPGICGPDL